MSESAGREDAVLDAALALPAAERKDYVARACGGDEPLRLMVEALLQAYAQGDALLEKNKSSERCDTNHPSEPDPADTREQEGDRIGRYKLLQQIGEGGCGVVYMAEQEEPVKRRVALKVIKLGMDTKRVVARFEAERQALALMDHTNIAKVLDGGTTKTGRPFFVMELVRGIPITRFCDENKLDTRQRLGLFVRVCQAIQHAHQKGIIHRDIKPSNILVADHDGAGMPKVIDFGIAKATAGQTLTDKTLFTAFEQFIGTPTYMSPEQAKLSGLDIDTRSDIYSLGVLLYELLTGQTPFDAKRLVQAGFEEICRVIREEEPLRPSTRLNTLEKAELTTVAKRRHSEPPKLLGLLRGDLDWIVMKTLEKDRSRRYETANGLARDLERYLNDEPVTARPPSNVYRFGKLVRRHKVGFAAAGAVAMALVLGLGLSTWFFFRERAARSATSLEARKSQRVADFLKEMLNGVTPAAAKGQDTTLLRLVLDKTAQRVGTELTNDPGVMADLQTKLGQVYWAIGEYGKSETNLSQAVSIRRKLRPSGLELAESLDALSLPLWSQGRLPEAEQAQREALALRLKLLPRSSQEVATSLNNLGVILNEQGKLDQSQPMLEEALAIQQGLANKDEARIAETMNALSSTFWRKRQFDKAENLDRQALALYRKVRDEMDPDVAQALNNLGTVLSDEGNFDEAISVHRKALEIQKNLFKHDHPDMATSLHNLAKALWEHGEWEGAEASYRQLLTVWTNLHGPESPYLAITLNNLGTVLEKEGRRDEAETSYREALEMDQKLHLDGEIPAVLNNLAGLMLSQRKLSDAEPLFREVVVLLKKTGSDPHNVATCLRSHAVVLRDLGKLDQAEKVIRECLSLCEGEPSLQDNWRKFDAMSVLGEILVLGKQYERAEPLLLSGNAGLLERADKIPAANKPRLKQTFDRLIALYTGWGQPQKAEQWAQKLQKAALPQP